MSKFGVMIMGPAGAGKTTFCNALISHLRTSKRSAIYVNLDPAAENFAYEPDVDIKELISLEDVMDEMQLGPNGGLLYCFEYLLEHIDFLTEPLESVTDEYLIVIDMPGQIELYTHIPVVPALVQHLTRSGSLNINLCAAYLLEATFVVDRPKFFSGALSAMSAMLLLELPHVNILSKMDLVAGTLSRADMRRFVEADVSLLDSDAANQVFTATNDADDDDVDENDNGDEEEEEEEDDDPASTDNLMAGASFKRLNQAVAQLIDEYSMVSFLRLNVQDEESVGSILSYIDDAIQFHEAQEPREPNDEIQID